MKNKTTLAMHGEDGSFSFFRAYTRTQHDAVQQVAADLPQHGNLPSESTVLATSVYCIISTRHSTGTSDLRIFLAKAWK